MPFKRFESQGFCQMGVLWARRATQMDSGQAIADPSLPKLTLSSSTGCSPSCVQNRQHSGFLSPRYMGSPLFTSRVSRYWHGSKVTVTRDARAETRVQFILLKYLSTLETKNQWLESPSHPCATCPPLTTWLTQPAHLGDSFHQRNQLLIDSKFNPIDLSLLFESLKLHREKSSTSTSTFLESPLIPLTHPIAVQAYGCPLF